jgi:hypothetical protein
MLIFAIVLYKSCAIDIHKHLRLLPPKNYVRIVAFTLKLQRTFFSHIIMFLCCSTTIKLLPLMILMGGMLSKPESLTIA